MKITSLILLAGFSLGTVACSRSDEDTARRQAREAAHTVAADAHEASRELDHDLRRTRDKVHEELHDTH